MIITNNIIIINIIINRNNGLVLERTTSVTLLMTCQRNLAV